MYFTYSAERYSYSYSDKALFTEPIFDHEKLLIHRTAGEYEDEYRDAE
jgi:hypothetical protein